MTMYDAEVEKAVLFYMIFDGQDFDIVEEDFADRRNRKIAVAINELKRQKEEISMMSIAEKIRANKQQILSYLSELGEYVFGSSGEAMYNRLLDYSKRRQIYEMMKKVDEEVIEDADNLIEQMINKLNQIGQRNEKRETFSEQVIDTMNEIENNYKQRSDYSLYTGLVNLDKILLGLHRKELTIIGARPGVGKTTMALQIAEHIARKGKWVCIVSLEMAETQLIQKIIARISKVNGYKLRSGNLVENDFEKVASVCGDLNELPFCISSKCKKIQEIEVLARKLKNERKLDLLVIDYIQLIKSNNRFGNREQEVAEISRTLKLLSLELDIPVVGLCQLNRNATRNEPSLADLRESGAIEQDADNVIFLYQEEGQEEAIKTTVIAKVAKQRAGEVGKVRLSFKKSNSEFVSLIK